MGILHSAFYASITHTFIYHMSIRLYVICQYVYTSYVNMFIRSYTYMLMVTNTNRTDINLDVNINIFALTVDYFIDH